MTRMGAIPRVCAAPGCLDAARRWDGRPPLVPTAAPAPAPVSVPLAALGLTGSAGAPASMACTMCDRRFPPSEIARHARDCLAAARATLVGARHAAIGGTGAHAVSAATALPTPWTSVSAASVIKELGEIRRIGQTTYFIKDGEVFDIDSTVLNRLSIGLKHTTHKNDKLARYELIRMNRDPHGRRLGLSSMQEQDFSCFTADEIRTFRGPRAFASTNQAEAHWEALMEARRAAEEEAEIVAEARRRLAEEERAAATAAREARIAAAMQNLRP